MKDQDLLPKGFERIPAHLIRHNHKYVPIIYKAGIHDYIAMYAKYEEFINPKNYLFKVCAVTFDLCVESFLIKIDLLTQREKICGLSWVGDKEIIDMDTEHYPQPPTRKSMIIV